MVRAIMIVEMAGRPAEHLTTALEEHIGVLNKVDDITVHSIKVSEPVEIKMEEDMQGDVMFTAFAEADFEADSFSRLSETMFDFMPSSVEVIEPSKISMDTSESTALLNNISGRMHRYDEIAKIAGARLQQMNAQLQAAQTALIEKDKTIVELSGNGKPVAGGRKIGLAKKKSGKKKVVKKKVAKKKAKK